MNDKGSGLAEVGLFLLLAFVFPGYVYLGFFILYFPETYSSAIKSFGFQDNSGLFALLLGVVGGLLLTSICFAIELLLRKRKYFDKRLFPNMGIDRLSVIEAKGRGSLHIRQVTGQAIMHFNIALGLLVPIVLTCSPKIGPLEMRDSCKITTGGSKSENKKVFGGADIPNSQRS